MTTEAEQLEIIEKGRAAQALRNNPALEEAFSLTLETAFVDFCNTTEDQGAERDAIWASVNALQRFKSTLDAQISSGRVEEKNREYDLSQQ